MDLVEMTRKLVSIPSPLGSTSEIEENKNRGVFTPIFVHEYGILVSENHF